MFRVNEQEWLSKIEIDITDSCNLKCPGCSRACGIIPSNNFISLNDITKFVNESIEEDWKWKSIMIIGGEPTLHPYLMEIITILYSYVIHSNMTCELKCMTNSTIDFKFPSYVNVIRNPDHSRHHAFYVSPTDENLMGSNTEACESIRHCGMGYGMYGYTPCPLGSMHCRIFGYSAIKYLKDVNKNSLLSLCNTYCKHCGWYLVDPDDALKGKILDYPVSYMSKTWLSKIRK